MSGPDLSILTVPELKQLQRLARGRRDGAMKDHVEWELASRAALSSRLGADYVPPLPATPEPTADRGPLLRPEPKASRSPMLISLAGGLAAGSLLTAGGVWAAGGLDGWGQSARVERPTRAAQAEVAAPKPVPPKPKRTRPVEAKPVVLARDANASGSAVADVLAPEPFPARIPPPPPPAPPVTQLAQAEPPPATPVAAIAPDPAPAEVAEARPEAAPKAEKLEKAEKATLAEREKRKAKAELARKKEPRAKPTELAAKAPVKTVARAKPAPAAKAPPEHDDPIAVLLARAEKTAAGGKAPAR